MQNALVFLFDINDNFLYHSPTGSQALSKNIKSMVSLVASY